MPNKIEKLPDGNFNVELETGERFTGDALSVTEKMAEAHVNTKRWGQEWKQKAEAVQQPVQAAPEQHAVDPQQKATEDWVATTAAKGFGLGSAEDLKRQWQDVMAFTEQAKSNMAITQFYQMHPEYPGSQAAHDVIGKIMEERNWPLSADNLEAAHLTAMQRKLYEPVPVGNSQGQQYRPTPPPMLQGSNPEQYTGNADPYNMTLADLRKLAIQQQLGGNK